MDKYRRQTRKTGVNLKMALKKVFQARAHRERSQPQARQRLGLLEKHSDYVLRARDFHKKENRLKALKQKAAMKNPDEFYFGMINAKTTVQQLHIFLFLLDFLLEWYS